MKLEGRIVHTAQISKQWAFLKFTDGTSLHLDPVIGPSGAAELSAVMIEPKHQVDLRTTKEGADDEGKEATANT